MRRVDMLDQVSVFDRETNSADRPRLQGWTVLGLSLLALFSCLVLIGIGAFVLSQLGLAGLHPIDPRDAYYGT
jgi:hypothetical protein